MEAAHSFETSMNIYQKSESVNTSSFQVAKIKCVWSVKVNISLDKKNTPE
jgi:hypothetical protein